MRTFFVYHCMCVETQAHLYTDKILRHVKAPVRHPQGNKKLVSNAILLTYLLKMN